MATVGGRVQRLVAALGLDCLVLALVLPGAVGRPTTASATQQAVVVVFLALCYWTVDLLGRLGGTSADDGRAALTYRIKLGLLVALVALVTVLPTVVAIGARRDSGLPYRDIGDSSIEVEQDAAFSLQGTNYYARTFFDTPLARWWPVGPPNPALYHADKLPGEVVLAAVLSLPLKGMMGWFDVRLLYLLALGGVVALALRLARGPTESLALVAALALNPLFVPSLISGDDDILVLVEILATIACARRGWLRAALLVLGVACATKYTAVLAVPFLLCWVAGRRVAVGGDRGQVGRALLADAGMLLLPIVVLIGPFLAWNAGAYLESTVGFIAGTAAHSYPILGRDAYGLGTFVVLGGLVRSANDYFPFGIVQVVVSLPLLAVLLWRQWRDNTLPRALAGYATLFLVVSYAARFFPGRYVAYAAALCAAAYFLGGQKSIVARREAGTAAGAATQLGLDLLVLLLLVPRVLAQPVGRGDQLTAAAALFLVTLYAALAALATQGGRGTAARLQTVLLLMVIGLLVLWPSTYAVSARHHSKPYTYVTDNAMQIEYGTAFLLDGRNPYAVSYAGTPMAQWYGNKHMTQALYHADELPLNFLLTVPALLLGRGLVGWFDERFLLLPLLAVALACVWLLGGTGEERRARLAAVALGPLFVPDAIYGDTDVIVVAALVAALLGLRARRWGVAAVAVGLTLAAKQTALFLYPLYLAYLWGTAPAGLAWQGRVADVWRRGWPSLVVPVVSVAPFLLWDAAAFWASTVGFLAGTIPHAYLIRGVGAYGFGALVVLWHLVSSDEAYFPFTALQALCLAPLLVVCCRALARGAGLPLLVAAYAVVMGLAYFFSRFLQDGGVGYILLVVALACLAPRAREVSEARRAGVRVAVRQGGEALGAAARS